MASMSLLDKFGRRSSLLIFGTVLDCNGHHCMYWSPLSASSTGRHGQKRYLDGPYGNLGFAAKIDCQAAASGLRICCVLARHKRRIRECNPCHSLGIRLCAQRHYRNMPATRSCWNSRLLRHPFQAMRNAWFCLRNGCSTGVEWYIGLIALTIFYNIDECTVLWPIDLLSILYVVACCGLAKAARQTREIRKIEAMYTLMGGIYHMLDEAEPFLRSGAEPSPGG